MRIDWFQVLNFKSYLDSGALALSPGMNVVVGGNSAGKSALLDALGLRFLGRPHRSLQSLPHAFDAEGPLSCVIVEAQCTGIELKRSFLRQGGQYYCPWPAGRPQNEHEARALIAGLFSSDFVTAQLQAHAGVNNPAGVYMRSRLSLTWRGGPAENALDQASFFFTPTSDRRDVGTIGLATSGADMGQLVALALLPRIFRFQAERLNVGMCPVGVSTVLLPDARNLPEVLSNLQANPDLFDEYERRVQEVFPLVQAVTTRAALNNQVEVRVWQLPRETRRHDLAFPLNECGTGIGQVLAILYTVIVSEDPQIIVIDEPNSFLHPGAARALVRVLRQFPQHQYIIATHAPEVIAEAGDCPVIRVEWCDGTSRCRVYPVRDTALSRQLLLDLGARLGDVFGFDEILWVEGSSDQACLKVILEQEFQPRPGLAILPVRDTGNFDRRRASDIIAIYRQASMASALVPPTIGFLLDRERRTDADVDRVKNETKGAVSFLDRAMIENYLLDPRAIAEVLSAEWTSEGHRFDERQIEGWVRENGCAEEYRAAAFEPFSENWLRRVDGAKLLRALFAEIPPQPSEFRKTIHCEALTRAILRQDSGHLYPLADVLEEKLSLTPLKARRSAQSSGGVATEVGPM